MKRIELAKVFKGAAYGFTVTALFFAVVLIAKKFFQ
jgi:hypothetical protein